MAYQDRFNSTDELIQHLDTIVPSLTVPFLQGHYSGFLAVAGITVYELAIKDIFYAFADKKHKVLGAATRNRFERLNGQIKLGDLKARQITFFGEKYIKRFQKELEITERKILLSDKVSIQSMYGNLVIWRHSFAHKSSIPATYEEVKIAYEYGKEVISCLDSAMVR